MVVHTFGVPAAIVELLQIARRHGPEVIEDACEALDAEHQGVRVGTLADAGVFAFYANKQMTTGEGCMLVTRSRSVADKVRSLRNQGRTQEDWFEHATTGYNYHLSEMQAAPGLSQLRRIDKMLALRTEIARLYACALADANDLTLPVAAVATGTSVGSCMSFA